MATKPTTRIPDWASGGTRTDPGAGKEASGWAVSERPPAEWWNWILGAIGDWLSWSETSIDANEVDIAALQELQPKARGTVAVASGVATKSTDSYGFTPTVSGGSIVLTWDTAFADTDYFMQVTNANNTGFILSTSRPSGTFAWVHATNKDGSAQDPASVDMTVHIEAVGAQ